MNIRDFPQFEFSNGVVKINDELFLHQENRLHGQFEYFLGKKLISDKSVKNFKSNIERGVALSEELGFKYLHIVFPSKVSVYKELFSSFDCKITPMFSQLHEHSHVFFPPFTHEHYDSVDTHTNHIGIVYLLNCISERFNYEKGTNPIWKSKMVGGDLSIMLKTGLKCKTMRFNGFGSQCNMKEIKYYSIANALDGNTGQFEYTYNRYAVNNLRVVLFGDSFFRSRLKIFSSLFSEVVFFRNPYVLEDVVRNLTPDIVLSGNAERYLADVPDCMSDEPWFLNYLKPNFNSQNVEPEALLAFKRLFSNKKLSQYGIHIKTVKNDIESLNSLDANDISNPSDIDFIRDIAVEYEKENFSLSFRLMKIAHRLRPGGLFIKEKLKEYESVD